MTITYLQYVPFGHWHSLEEAGKMAQRMSDYLDQEWIWCMDSKRSIFRIVRVK